MSNLFMLGKFFLMITLSCQSILAMDEDGAELKAAVPAVKTTTQVFVSLHHGKTIACEVDLETTTVGNLIEHILNRPDELFGKSVAPNTKETARKFMLLKFLGRALADDGQLLGNIEMGLDKVKITHESTIHQAWKW